MNYKLLFQMELEKNKQLENEKNELLYLVDKYKREAKFWHKKSIITPRTREEYKSNVGLLYG